MATKLDFSQSPYFDDFDETNDFYKILYRPGYAVQARELTQMQSILQNQITKFGDHVFQNGSQVIPGSVNIDPHMSFIKLDSFYETNAVDEYLASFRNTIITGLTSGVKMQVIDSSDCDCVETQLDILTLYVKPVENDSSTGTIRRPIAGETIVAYAADNTVAKNPDLTADLSANLYANIRSLADNGTSATEYTYNAQTDVIGNALQVDVKEGIYYIDGYFVRTPELHLYVGRFDPYPSARVGFKVSEAIVTPEENSDLLDNATGSTNYAAPGAHRYEITVTLISKDIETTGNATEDEERFIELLRLVDGKIQMVKDKSSYAELEKTFARRTFDESGNYEVNKFKLNIKEHLKEGTNNGVYAEDEDGNRDQFVVELSSGKAYIQGYEVESISNRQYAVDKARENSVSGSGADHVVRVDDKSIAAQVGNYVIVNTTYNYPDIENFETVYLLDSVEVTAGNGITSGDAAIVGTARVRGFQLHSGDYADGNDTEYKLSLFDIKMSATKSFEKNVKQIVSTAGSNAFIGTIVPEKNYVVGSVTLESDNLQISGVGTSFTSEVIPGDFVYVDGNFIGQVDVVNNDYDLDLKSAYTTADFSGTRMQVGRAELFSPNYNGLLFPIGHDAVKTLRGWDGLAYTEKSTSVSVRRIITPTNISGSSPNYVAQFELTGTNEAFLSLDSLQNFLLFNTSTNTFIDISTSDLSYGGAGSDDNTILKISNLSVNTLELIATIRISSNVGAEKTKTRTIISDTITGQAAVSKNTVELTKADGYSLTSVSMTPGNFSTYSASGAIDITNRYEFDDGQRPSYYTNAKLILKPGYQPPNGAIKVTYSYFAHGTTGQYFSVDSYIDVDAEAMDLGDIPSFTRTDANGRKQVVKLSSVIDFRPVLHSSSTHKPQIPAIGSSIEASVAYYLGRIDKLTLDSYGGVNVVRGIPSLKPQEPDDPIDGSMVLATLIIPPFTANASDIVVKQRENRRYTMKDIGRIEKRVKNLEYYVTLNLLEKDTADLQITDNTTGIDRFKNGFIVDNFTGHGIGDVKNVDYRIAVDKKRRQLRPMHYTAALTITENIDSYAARSGDYKKTNDLITLPYTQTHFISNPLGTRTIDVNPYKIGAFKGEIELWPEGDTWKDTDRRPDLFVTDDNNFDAIKYLADELGVTGTEWEEWVNNWTGQTVDVDTSQTWNAGWGGGYVEKITTEDTGTATREGLETTVQTAVNTVDYGDRVVDISYAASVRRRPVTFIARNLKPFTRFYAYFDNIDVNLHCQPANVLRVVKENDYMTFEYNDLVENILQDDPRRSWMGEVQPAYMGGDVLKNAAHTATDVDSITYVTTNTIDVEVASTTGIRIGHHIRFYNMDFHNAYDVGMKDSPDNSIPASSGIADTDYTAKALNYLMFNVIDVDTGTNTIRLKYINMTGDSDNDITASTDLTYTPASGYTDNTVIRGKLLRLQGSCVVAHAGIIPGDAVDADGTEYDAFDATGNINVQDLHIVNLKHGISVGETLYGSTTIDYGGSSIQNQVTVIAVNGEVADDAPPTYTTEKGYDVPTVTEAMRADAEGTLVGTFFIPNDDTLYFPVGEKSFKLTDSESNSNDKFDSFGSKTYFALGMTLSKEKTIVNSRQANFVEDRVYADKPIRRVTTSNRNVTTWWNPPPPPGDGDGGGGDGHDPLAQTFTVKAMSSTGVFVTSVDLYFKETGTRPVIVELRTTSTEGVPSTKIIPFSSVTIQPSNIKVSDDGTVPTTFTFKAPIYLQDSETYALVIKTDQPGLRAWVSELGSTDIATGNIVTKTPLAGSLYLSQNSKEFEINPLLDMKFTLRKAEFDISSTVEAEFRANPPLDMALPIDPFEITPNTNKIRVYAPNHGFEAGDLVRFSFNSSINMPLVVSKNTFYGHSDPTQGIPQWVFENTHTVYSSGIDKDSFIIDMNLEDGSGNSLLVGGITNADFVKGEYGGSKVRCTRALQADQLYFKGNNLVFPQTNLSWYIDDGLGSWSTIQENSDYLFGATRKIDTFDNCTPISGTELREPPLTFKATFNSANKNVSPVIDVQQLSAYITKNMINNSSFGSVNVSEIDLRDMLDSNDISATNLITDGTGTLTIGAASNTVTGTSTVFETQLRADDLIYQDTTDVLLGRVHSITSDTEFVLTDQPGSKTGIGWYIVPGNRDVEFYNDHNGYGVIKTRIDIADNLLASVAIGKHLYIDGVNSDIDNDTVPGTWVVHNIVTNDDADYYAGNTELDNILIYVKNSVTGGDFGSNIGNLDDEDADGQALAAVRKDLVDDTFTIQMYDKFVEDFAPVGTHNDANYVTRTLNLDSAATALKILFDGNIVTNTNVKLYYRIWSGDTDLRKLPYIDSGFDSTEYAYEDEGEFVEKTIDLENLPSFYNVQIKIVMKSSNSVYVPKIKNLRMIAHS